jgi:DNA-binding NarL/FixJ family response regulator
VARAAKADTGAEAAPTAARTGTAETAIRLLVADDHPMVRIGLREMLSRSARAMAVVAEAGDGQEAVAQFRQHRPDVAILDVRMPRRSGIDAIAAIRAEFPGSRLIALGDDDDADVYRALRAGAKAYVLKNVGREELVQTVAAVHQGRGWLAAEVADRLVEGVDSRRLTPRELEVLEQMARGASNAGVASSLGISTETVKVHVKHILDKLAAENRSQAVSTALKKGLVGLG